MHRHRRSIEKVRREQRKGDYREWGLGEHDTFEVSIDLGDVLLPTEEPDDGIISFGAKLTVGHDVVGSLDGYLVDTDRADSNGESYADFFDAHSQTVCSYGEQLFDLKRDTLSKAAMRALKLDDQVLTAQSFVIVDRVEVVKEHQRKGLGVLFLERVLELLAKGYTFVAIEPFPMQYGVHRDSELDSADERAQAAKWRERHLRNEFAQSKVGATKRLVRYWETHGFVRVGKSSIWVRQLYEYDW